MSIKRGGNIATIAPSALLANTKTPNFGTKTATSAARNTKLSKSAGRGNVSKSFNSKL
jgi:hypothetical protein